VTVGDLFLDLSVFESFRAPSSCSTAHRGLHIHRCTPLHCVGITDLGAVSMVG